MSIAAHLPRERESDVALVNRHARAVEAPERKLAAAFLRGQRAWCGVAVRELADRWSVSEGRVAKALSGEAPVAFERLVSADVPKMELEFTRDFLDALIEIRFGAAANDLSEQLCLPGVAL